MVSSKLFAVEVPINICEVVADKLSKGCVHASYDERGINPKMEDEAATFSVPLPPAV